jgi:hypothetical protein
MIEIKTLTGTVVGNYKDYDELCDYIMEQENIKLLEPKPDLRNLQWSFTVCESRKMITICTGDFMKLRHVVLTPGVDLAALKAKWCRYFCRAHGLVINFI